MSGQEEVDIISQIRGEVMAKQDVTGENLFLAWGYPTAIVLLLEFAALMIWHEDWCSWLWPWQLLIAAVIAVIALIIPGHLFRRYVRSERQRF